MLLNSSYDCGRPCFKALNLVIHRADLHICCRLGARFRLLLAGQSPPPDYAYLNECGWKPPRVFDIKAQGDPDAFARRVMKDVLIQTLQNNGIAFKRSWNKARLWRALLSHK